MTDGEKGWMRIGQLSRAVGVSDQAIRYYERLGLLRPAKRTQGGARLYGPEATDRLHAIKRAQALGFALADIGLLFDPERKGDVGCLLAQARLRAQREHLESDLAALRMRREEVARLEAACGACEGICRLEEELEPHFP